MGLNTAYQIARRSPAAKIKVLEQCPGIGYGSSGASSAILRHLYSKEPMIRFAQNGIHHYKHWNEYLQSKQTVGRFVQTGWLLMSALDKQTATDYYKKYTECYGIPTSIIDAATMKERFPQINSDCGVFDNEGKTEWTAKPMDDSVYFFMEEEAGCFEPMDALTDLKNVLQSAKYASNVELCFNSKVSEILHSNGKVKGVQISSSDGVEEVQCEYVINCCGPYYNSVVSKLNELLDIKFTVKPVRMQVIYKDAPNVFSEEFLTAYKCQNKVPIPIIVDYFSGFYVRPQRAEKQLVAGTCVESEEMDELDPAKDEVPQGADPEKRNKYLNSLYHRLEPVNDIMGTSSKVHSISGLYTKTDDVHYLIGETKLKGFIVCNGFSGHGQKCAPAVGSMVAQYVSNTKIDGDTDVDIEFFSPYRVPYHMKVKNVMA